MPPESGDIAVISRLVIVPASRAISNHAEVARTLGIDIITGHYPEGAKLPGDAELIRLFGISRPVLREGVKTRSEPWCATVQHGICSTPT